MRVCNSRVGHGDAGRLAGKMRATRPAPPKTLPTPLGLGLSWETLVLPPPLPLQEIQARLRKHCRAKREGVLVYVESGVMVGE